MLGLPPELVAAVLESPHDIAPRLACADWIEEGGDADAGALVRAQARLARSHALRLSSKAVGVLNAEVAALLGRNEARWVLGPLGVAGPRGVRAKWEGGFVVSLRLGPTCRVPVADILPRLGEFPLLRRLEAHPRRPVPLAALGALPTLADLRRVGVLAEGDILDAETVAALAAQPRLREVSTLARRDGRWGDVPLPPAEWARVEEARAERLREVPAVRLLEQLRILGRSPTATRAGLSLSIDDHSDAMSHVFARLPDLVAVSAHGPRVPGWLAAHPNLRGLSLSGLREFDPRPLAGLTALRYVSLRQAPGECDWAALWPWLESLPELACLGLPWTTAPASARLPALRSLDRSLDGYPIDAPNLLRYTGPATVLPGPGVPLRAVCLYQPWSDDLAQELRERGVWWHQSVERSPLALGEPEAFGGVSLRLPAWFRRVPTPPEASRDGVEVLATWVEWGDGDPRDRVMGGPAWVRLERLPHRVRAAEAAAALGAPPSELGDDAMMCRVERVAGPPPFRVASGYALGHCLERALWSGRRSALRLLVETPSGDAVLQTLARAIGRTLTGDIDA